MKISIDQARLRPHLRAAQPVHLFGEPVMPAEATASLSAGVKPKPKFFKPEPGDLRGIPMIGPGVGGVQPGTNPLSALIAKEDRAAA